MNVKTIRLGFRMTVVLLFSFCAAQLAAGQTAKQLDEKETAQALLSEVTLLRQAMQSLQRMTLDTYRSQLIVERVRSQREDVRRLTAALDQTRDDVVRTSRAIPNSIEQQKLLDVLIQQEADTTKRAQLEFDLKRSKDGVEMYKSQLDRLREREQDLASQLQVSKAKLDELEGRLDAVERSIEIDREKLMADKPAQSAKP